MVSLAFLVLVVSLGNSKVENGNEKFNDSKTKSDDIVNAVEGTLLQQLLLWL